MASQRDKSTAKRELKIAVVGSGGEFCGLQVELAWGLGEWSGGEG